METITAKTMFETYYTLKIKQRGNHINKMFELNYFPTNDNINIVDVINKHSHYNEAPYSIEAIAKYKKVTGQQIDY